MTTIIAHRGYSAKYPENTMLAFKEAAKHDIYGIELDVHLTRDQEVVIIHDEMIDRTSNGVGWVKDYTLAELRTFQFNNNMTKYDIDVDCKIPTLRDFLDWAKHFDFKVNIELKTNIIRYPGLVKNVLDIIEEYDGMQERIILSSFNHHSIREVRELNPNIETGFLTASGILEPGDYCKKHGVENYHPLFFTLDEADVENCRDNNVLINTYTVDQAEYMIPLIRQGIRNIITNEVELGIETVEQYS